MSNARKQYSPAEITQMVNLATDGWTYQQIAEKIRPGVKNAWRSVGEIVRRKREELTPTTILPALNSAPQQSASRSQSVGSRAITNSKVTMPDSMLNSMSAREFFSMINDEQRSLFVATYEDLRGQMDEEQLTGAENEMLIRAAFSNVKYLRAQYMLSLCESYLMMDLDGELTDSDEDKAKKRLAGRGDAYKKEAEQWHKEYMELLNDLKLTRKQRLDKIKDTRNTFLDLQQELMTQAKQTSIVEEIKRINMATREEFLRMAQGEVGPDGKRHPWLIGAFDQAMPPVSREGNSEPQASQQTEEISKREEEQE